MVNSNCFISKVGFIKNHSNSLQENDYVKELKNIKTGEILLIIYKKSQKINQPKKINKALKR